MACVSSDPDEISDSEQQNHPLLRRIFAAKDENGTEYDFDNKSDSCKSIAFNRRQKKQRILGCTPNTRYLIPTPSDRCHNRNSPIASNGHPRNGPLPFPQISPRLRFHRSTRSTEASICSLEIAPRLTASKIAAEAAL